MPAIPLLRLSGKHLDLLHPHPLLLLHCNSSSTPSLFLLLQQGLMHLRMLKMLVMLNISCLLYLHNLVDRN